MPEAIKLRCNRLGFLATQAALATSRRRTRRSSQQPASVAKRLPNHGVLEAGGVGRRVVEQVRLDPSIRAQYTSIQPIGPRDQVRQPPLERVPGAALATVPAQV